MISLDQASVSFAVVGEGAMADTPMATLVMNLWLTAWHILGLIGLNVGIA
jgi:hypothetical protein